MGKYTEGGYFIGVEPQYFVSLYDFKFFVAQKLNAGVTKT